MSNNPWNGPIGYHQVGRNLIDELVSVNKVVLNNLDEKELGFTIAQSVAVRNAVTTAQIMSVEAVEHHTIIYPHCAEQPDSKTASNWIDILVDDFIETVNS